MDHLTRNLAALARNQPELAARLQAVPSHPGCELRPARNGDLCLAHDGSLLCSSVDPAGEGRRLAESAPQGPLLVLGFGLGHHLEPLAGRDLVVLEPEPGRLRLALAARDLTRLLPGLRIALTPSELGEVSGRSLLVHRPTSRLHPGLADALEARLAPAPACGRRPGRPRVLVVGPLWGGTEPMARWCAQALEELGCQVRRPSLEDLGPLYRRVLGMGLAERREDEVLQPLLRFCGELVLAEAERFSPHLVLALAQAPLNPAALKALGGLGVIRAFWFVEDHRAMPYFRQVAPGYDYFFHLEGEELAAELRSLGTEPRFLPLAAHPPRHRPVGTPPHLARRFGAPVGFVGEGYPNRRRIFARLARAGLPLKVWGTGWPRQGPLARLVGEDGRRLSSAEVAMVYGNCPLVLNLHSSLEPGRGPGGAAHVNPRSFEAPACGALLLTDAAPGLERLLEPGREAVVFADEDELLAKARYYLEHESKRSALAAAGRRRVLAEHTYYHRMEDLLQTCLGPRSAQGAEPAGPGDPRRTAADQLFDHLAAPQRAVG